QPCHALALHDALPILNVEFLTSASRTTTRGFASPSLTRVAPKASRVATKSVGAYSGGATGWAGAGDREIGSGLRISTVGGVGRSRALNSASALSASSPFFKGLPCQSGLSSTNEMPFPLSVRARTTVGRPFVRAAWANASKSLATSCPSTGIAFQPNALHRER